MLLEIVVVLDLIFLDRIERQIERDFRFQKKFGPASVNQTRQGEGRLDLYPGIYL